MSTFDRSCKSAPPAFFGGFCCFYFSPFYYFSPFCYFYYFCFWSGFAVLVSIYPLSASSDCFFSSSFFGFYLPP